MSRRFRCFAGHRFRLVILATLLAIMTLGSLALALVTARALHQRDAVAALERLHCGVFYDYDPPGPWPEVSWKTREQPGGPAWLRSVVGPHYFDRAVTVRLDATIVDQAVHWLRQLPHLRHVYVNGGAACGLTTVDENEFRAVEYLRRELPTVKVDLTGPIMIVG